MTTVSGKSPSKAAILLVCRSARPIILEIESASARTKSAAKKYAQWTGGSGGWTDLEKTKHALDVGEGKWGAEYRIYFPKKSSVQHQLRRYGYKVESGGVRHRGTLRINNEALFKELVAEHGLELGKNS